MEKGEELLKVRPEGEVTPEVAVTVVVMTWLEVEEMAP